MVEPQPVPQGDARASNRALIMAESHLSREFDARLAVALRAGRISVYEQDRNLRYTWIRNALGGLTESDFIGRTTSDVFPGEVSRIADTVKRCVMRTGIGESIELTYPGTAGIPVHTRSFIEPLRDPSGTIIGVMGAVYDISEQKEAEAKLRVSEARSRFLLQLSDQVRGVADPTTALQIVIKAVSERLNVDRCSYSEISVAENWIEAIASYDRRGPPPTGRYPLTRFGVAGPEDHPNHTSVICDVETDPRTKSNAEAFEAVGIGAYVGVPVFKEGVLVASFGVNHGQARQWTTEEVELLEEVAERTWQILQHVRAESRIRTLNQELENRVIERTDELRAANTELEGFTYSVSHDLRGPLRTINATSKILLEDLGTELPEEARQLLTKQASAAGRLGQLIDDLLKLSRIARQEISRVSVDVSALALSVSSELVPGEFDIQPGMLAAADEDLLRFVLLNLMENAAKFSPQGTKIQVGRKLIAGRSAFFVADHGIGFDMRYAEKLFLPFERLVRQEEFPGTGIGLANVKRIVERHGGEVWAESEPGKGATFYFTLE